MNKPSIVSRVQLLLLAAVVAFVSIGCSAGESRSGLDESTKQALINHPEWTKSANIYEVNIRQNTPEGTFNAFREDLPRLKEMGVDIIWLMPIHPIGEKNRKGELGSYYSIKDYRAVNPNFGTLEDFKALVDSTHKHGMKLILDWVPNHTAWDHPWITEHPEYYAKDSTGAITYEADWTDIALLNYENKELWPKMIDAMKYWINEADIDGFRVDHASHEIPMAFWEQAVPEIDQEKEGLFWLAEWDEPKLHPVFDASYPWEYFHMTTDIAKQNKPLSAIDEYMDKEQKRYPEHAYRMYFTSNHDENSWNGTDRELFGENFQNFAVLAATIDGMPLVYNGQESGLYKQLEFFEKDTINWKDYKYQEFYATLFDLKDRNEALWNGQYGGEFVKVANDKADSVYSFKRVKGEDEVMVVLNISGSSYSVSFPGLDTETSYTNVFTGEEQVMGSGPVEMSPYSFLVLEK